MTTNDTDSGEASSPKKGLAARLQSAAAADEQAVESYRKQMQAEMQKQLSELGDSSRELWKRELRTIEDDIRRDTGSVAQLTSRLWKHLLWFGLIASGALFVGLWGPLQWHSSQLQELRDKRQELAAEHLRLRQEIVGYEMAISALQKKTGGIQVMEIEGKPWVVVPKACRKSKGCVQLPDDWASE